MSKMVELKKWGNGNGIRIPKAFLEALGCELDSKLTIVLDLESRELILSPFNSLNEEDLERDCLSLKKWGNSRAIRFSNKHLEKLQIPLNSKFLITMNYRDSQILLRPTI